MLGPFSQPVAHGLVQFLNTLMVTLIRGTVRLKRRAYDFSATWNGCHALGLVVAFCFLGASNEQTKHKRGAKGL